LNLRILGKRKRAWKSDYANQALINSRGPGGRGGKKSGRTGEMRKSKKKKRSWASSPGGTGPKKKKRPARPQTPGPRGVGRNWGLPGQKSRSGKTPKPKPGTAKLGGEKKKKKKRTYRPKGGPGKNHGPGLLKTEKCGKVHKKGK